MDQNQNIEMPQKPTLLSAANCSGLGRSDRQRESARRMAETSLRRPEVVAKRVAWLKQAHLNPEMKARRVAALRSSEKMLRANRSAKHREASRQSAAKNLTTKEALAKNLASCRASKDFERSAKNLGKAQEKHWLLKSPDNQVFEVKNLNAFVRDNPHLFPEGYATPIKNAGFGWRTKAAGGLRSISPRNKNAVGSWMGWTWVSIVERLDGCVALDVDCPNK